MNGGATLQAALYYQNNVAALRVLDLLKPGGRDASIQLDCPKHAKHIDDIIVHYPGRDEFIQVKWREDDRATITLSSLIAEDDSSISLLRKLAEGFESLKRQENSLVVLLSTQRPSNRRDLSKGLYHGLKSFIEDVLEPLQAADPSVALEALDAYSEYEGTLVTLKTATGLGDAEFENFLRHLTFKLDQPSRDAMQREVRVTLQELGIGEESYNALLVGVVEWSISAVQVSRETVLRTLGIADRFLDPLEHIYPVDERLFVEDESLFCALDHAINTLSGGPILVEGPPGIGKSTALSVYRERRPDVTLGYYCYVPEEPTFTHARLERETFLKSLCVRLRDSFPDIHFPQEYSANSLEKLDRMFSAISESGSTAVLIIDGLDYVYSNRDVLDQPLLDALDGTLPDNVFMIVSCQNITMLPPGLQHQIGTSGLRHIVVKRMSRVQCSEFVRRRNLDVEEAILQSIYEISEGIPLYLHYICKQLSAEPMKDWARLVDSFPSLEEKGISEYHDWVLTGMGDGTLQRWIINILSYRHEYTSIETICELLRILDVSFDLIQVDDAVRSLAHLLKSSDANAVAIFHNSLRDDVLRREPALSDNLDKAMVEFYDRYPTTDEAFRNRYRHLLSLHRYREILDDCDGHWLHRQWEYTRPLDEIQSNLSMAWRAAIEVNEFLEYVRIALLQQELGVIRFNLELCECRMPHVLLELGKRAEAVRQIWDGARVHAKPSEFFRFVLHFRVRTGDLLKQSVFDAALAQLQRPRSEEDLGYYYQSLALYRSWDEVAEQILGCRWVAQSRDGTPPEPVSADAARKTNESLMEAVVELLAEHKDIGKLMDAVKSNHSYPAISALATARASCLLLESGETEDGVALCGGIDLAQLSGSGLTRLVVCLAEAGQLGALGEIPELPEPEFFSPLTREDTGTGLRHELFEVYDALRASLAVDATAHRDHTAQLEALSNPEHSIFGALVELANLWAVTTRKELTENSKGTVLRSILRQLNIPRTQLSGSHRFQGHYVGQGMHRIYTYLFRYAARNLGSEALGKLVDFWLELDRGRDGYKSTETNIEAAKLLHVTKGASVRSSTCELLRRAEELARMEEETSSLVQGLLDCVGGYGACGFADEAMRVWRDVFWAACGVYFRKDYQFHRAIGALRRTHESRPEATLERLATLLVRAHQFEAAAGGAPSATAIEELICVGSLVSPELAFELLTVEDASILRERALEGLVDELLARSDVPLSHLWSVARTMDKWSNFHAFKDYTYPTLRRIYLEAVGRSENELAEEILRQCRQLLVVEKGQPELLSESEGLRDADTSDEMADQRTETPDQASEASQYAQITDRIRSEPFTHMAECESAAREQLSGRELAHALFLVAERHASLSPEKAVSLLDDAWESNALHFHFGDEDRVQKFFELYFSLDPARAKHLLLQSFRDTYSSYASEIIYRLDRLLPFAKYFADQPTPNQLFELYDAYSSRLVESLPAPAVDLSWVAQFEEEFDPSTAIVGYLVDLFNYPQVEVRRLALEALAWLGARMPELLDVMLSFCDEATENSKEHAVVLLSTLSMVTPAFAVKHKGMLLHWAEEPHFNLRQSIKELLLIAHERVGGLADNELEFVRSLNIVPTIAASQSVDLPESRARNFVPSPHLTALLYELENTVGLDDAVERVLMELSALGWTVEEGMEVAQDVHRQHNINTNFDGIELLDPYSQAFLDAENRVLAKAIQAQQAREDAIEAIRPRFRLYDPSSLARQVVKRPASVDWLAGGRDEQSFLEFDDIATLAESLRRSGQDRLYLYQDGHQRLVKEYRTPTRRTFFRASAFAVEADLFALPEKLLASMSPRPTARVRNAYRSELPDVFPVSTSFPVDGVTPLVGVSLNRFRGRNELSLASLLPDIVADFGLVQDEEDPLAFRKDGSAVIEFTEWMEPYDQGRRRQLPIGAGVLLTVKRKILGEWLVGQNMKLAWFVEVHRSMDQYKPESEMDWATCRCVICDQQVATEVVASRYDGADFV